MTESAAIVIDNGSGVCKAGIAGEEAPRAVFPSIVGKPKVKGIIVGLEQKEDYIGNEANEKRGVLIIKYPIEHGVITDFEAMRLIWQYTFINELRINYKDKDHPLERPVLLTEAPMNPKANREQMAEIMFEEFNAPKLYIGVQAVLALYASGRTTGLVLDSGDGVTHTVPIYEGYSIAHAICKQNLAGRDITEYTIKLLTERKINMVTTAETEITKDIKEKCSIVAFDPELPARIDEKTKQETSPDYIGAELAKKEQSTITYSMPDGQIITIGNERLRNVEMLFNPMMAGREEMGIHMLTFDSIKKADVDLRKSLYENVILSGGTTMYKNFPERLEKELKYLAPTAIQPKVFAAPERKFMVWVGGATASSISSFAEKWVEKKEWEEIGKQIIHTKCI